MDLFERAAQSDGHAPLADRMRPQRLSEIVGQEQLLGHDRLLSTAIARDEVPSMILWGPPGTGKTTLAHVIAAETRARFATLSAVMSGVADLRKALQSAEEQRNLYGKRTILFIDEIHRFNKAQQDALLPHVERGTIVLVGATTENPSFAVNASLLSRAGVFALEPLEEASIVVLLERALRDDARGLGKLSCSASAETLKGIASSTQGDARRALDVLEAAAKHAVGQGEHKLQVQHIEQALASSTLRYDKSGEEHYNVVSAFIKSLRGSDPDAALYWMMRMLSAGDDPLFVLRRMLIFASEDIGNADPNALRTAVAADSAFQRLGMPEGLHTLAQCCVYLACAPKSNATYTAWKAARQAVEERGALPVPKKLRNAPTAAMKAWGYGDGYRYPHDEDGYADGETYLPEALIGQRYYEPTAHGFEERIRERLTRLRKNG